MIKSIDMCCLEEGQRGCVSEIRSKGSMRRRLMELGLIKGTTVTCLHKSFKGDISAFLIKGAVIALRKEDSCEISLFVNQRSDMT